jgi:anti-sigma regulatory factor (Ser/Thr protein kinase)
MKHAAQPDEVALHLNLPADYRCLGVLSAAVAAVVEQVPGLPDAGSLTYDVQLAVQEACTNIVAHAYGDRIDGRIEATIGRTERPRGLIIHLYDTGESFDPSTVLGPDLSEPQTHGYGLHLMRALLDEVAYEPEDGRNHWQLVKLL